ncbi:MAG: cytosine permease [Firmicutes bacterium]|nr:cytosine permease [Bacillota bacterium]
MVEEKKKEKQMEDFALEKVKTEDRKSWISLAAVQTGIFICVPSLLLGALLTEAMPVSHAILAGVLGYCLTIFISLFLGMQGADLGVPSAVIICSTFGEKGSRIIISLLLSVSMIGWFGINCNVCGEAFSNLMGIATGIHIPAVVSSIIWGIIMLLSAIFGMNALKRLDAIAIPCLVIIMVLGAVMAYKNFGASRLYTDIIPTMNIVQGTGLSFSFTALAAVTCSDITRFQRGRKDTIKSTFWGIFPAGVFTLILGILMTKMADDYDISSVLATVGLPFLGILVLILATWTTNALNAYSAGLDVVMTFNLPDNKRRLATLVAGIVGIVLAACGILGHIETFLSLLSYVFSATGGIMLVDYWIVGKGKPESWHKVPGFNWAGIIAMVIGIAVAAIIGIDYTGLLWGAIVYLIVERFIPSQSRNLNGGI